ncbi:MAG: FHA domain-containing protein [Anaerolineae bacterium]
MPQYQLVVRRGPRAGETFELKSQTVIIGRDSTADIIINDPEVSRNHCRLILDRSYYLQDLGSTNGTFIDGQRLGGEPVRLANGQIIQLGSNVTLLHQEIETSDAIVSTRVKANDEDDALSVPAVPREVAPEIPASPTIPERDDQLPTFDNVPPVSAQADAPQTPPAMDRMPADPPPVYVTPPDYAQQQQAQGGFFNGGSPDASNGMPWANWTQKQWMIALGVLLLLLMCACCLFMATVVYLLRPDLFGAAPVAGMMLPFY